MWEHRTSYPSEGRYLKKDIEKDIEDGHLLRYVLEKLIEGFEN